MQDKRWEEVAAKIELRAAHPVSDNIKVDLSGARQPDFAEKGWI
jgi:hypothetical protein